MQLDHTVCASHSGRSDHHRNRPHRWSHRHELVLQRHLAGWRTSEIAAELRYSPHRVSMIINSPLFQDRKVALLRQLERDGGHGVLEQIRREAIPAIDVLCALCDNPDPNVQLRAARAFFELYDRFVVPNGR